MQRRPATSFRSLLIAVRLTALVLLLAGGTSDSWAQPVNASPFVAAGSVPAADRLALDGNTAVLVQSGVAFVFVRFADEGPGTFSHTATLTPSDGGAGFGRSVDIDGGTVVIGATGAAYVFGRQTNSAWPQQTKLTPPVANQSFGASVGVSGTLVVVGEPSAPNFGIDLGTAYIFENRGALGGGWGHVATLTGPGTRGAQQVDEFGSSVAIDDDRVVVGAFPPRPPLFPFGTALAYTFARSVGGNPNAWGRVATLPLEASVLDSIPAKVAIDGDTAVVGSFRPSIARVFERVTGDTEIWERIDLEPNMLVAAVSISGNLALVSSSPDPAAGYRIFARNEGTGWGEVARFAGMPSGALGVVSGDTVLLRAPDRVNVFVSDVDRDGIRDGIDLCPRDPLNNMNGRCQRRNDLYPVLDSAIELTSVTTATRDGQFVITATFANRGQSGILNPFFELIELTGGNVLSNADAGEGSVGSSLSPDVGNGILSPGESVTATFTIRLASHDPFQFHVSIRGVPVP